MKSYFLLIFILLFSWSTFSQSYKGLSFQSVIYDPELSSPEQGNFVPYVGKLYMQFWILDSEGNKEYVEEIHLKTDAFGMVNHDISSPSDNLISFQVLDGAFGDINWDGSLKRLVVYVDLMTGSFTQVSDEPFNYVPYAYYAKYSDSAMPDGYELGNTIYWDGIKWVTKSSNIYNDGENVMIGTTEIEESAALNVSSDNQGILIPRLTQEQRDNISSPVAGLLVFQTNETPGFYYFDGTAWINLAASNSNPSDESGSSSASSANTLIYTSDGF